MKGSRKISGSVAIVDYDAGNLASVKRACEYLGSEAYLCRDVEGLAKAKRIIFPGVGAADSAMVSLKKSGLDRALIGAYNQGVPILGICLGMQISLSSSEEGQTPTLNMIPGSVCRFSFNNPNQKIPHMGWNTLRVLKDHPVLENIDGEYFYFVHSYYPRLDSDVHAYGQTTYETEFISALGQGNFFGTQFHPEKSAEAGLRLIGNFLSWDGKC